MSKPCSCPLAGYCERHAVTKRDVWHRLCQSRESYRAAWDAGCGPGQKPALPAEEPLDGDQLTPAQLARRARIAAIRARDQRLIDWLIFLRRPCDRGIGDTAQRLSLQARRSPDAYAALVRLLKEWTCHRVTAIARLNAQHPY